MNNKRKIKVVSHDPHWLDRFKQEADKIANALKKYLKAIHPIGSTAIPGMPAKPVIDILIELESLDDMQMVAKQLSSLGFEKISRQIIPHRSFFSYRDEQGERFINLHIYERGDPQVARHINFRDYLTHHPADAHTYAELKKHLAIQFQEDINQYVLGKDKLVQAIDLKAKQWAAKHQHHPFLSQSRGMESKYWPQEKIMKTMEANFNVCMTHFAQYLEQVEFIRKPGFTLVNAGLLDDTFNYVLDADFSEENAHQKISEVSAYFTKKHTPFSWWLSPDDQPKDLMHYLEEDGYQLSENLSALYFDLDAWDSSPMTTKLKIIQARDQKTLQDFAEVTPNDPSAFKTYYSWISELLTDNDPIEYYVGSLLSGIIIE